jgi:signal transduction histidine kinase
MKQSSVIFTRLLQMIACAGMPAGYAGDASAAHQLPACLSQGAWFYLACLGATVTLAWLFYLMRMRQLSRHRNTILAAQLLERERIARALHDSWLQNIHILVLSLSSMGRMLPEGSTAREHLDKILLRADDVIIEGRRAIMGLRNTAVQPDDIGSSFHTLGSRLQREFGATFALTIKGAARPIQRTALQEIYYIGSEALYNAFRHASASRISLTLDFRSDGLGLTVIDDGVGIPDHVLNGGIDGHWGLLSMRERAAIIDGVLRLQSGPYGTQVGLQVPAAQGYAAGTPSNWLSRLKAQMV